MAAFLAWAVLVGLYYVNFLSRFFGLGVVFVCLEILWPRDEGVTWRTRLRGATFNLIFILATALALATVDFFHPKAVFNGGWPVVAGLIVVGDFLGYWEHRLMHAAPLLWRFHRTHHAITEMSAWASYKHWTEELFFTLLLYVPTALLFRVGLTPWSVLLILPVVNNLFAHSATRLDVGQLWTVWMDNRMHRIHHSLEPRHIDHNFGAILPLWDWLFGTLYVPGSREWPATGVADHPEPATFRDYLLDPITAR